MMILMKKHLQAQERSLRRRFHQIHQSPTSVPSVLNSPEEDPLCTPSRKRVLFVATLKPLEGIKPRSFPPRIVHMLMLIFVDPVGPPIVPFASCVVLSSMKPPWDIRKERVTIAKKVESAPMNKVAICSNC